MEINGRVPMCGRVVTSLRIATSDSRGTSVCVRRVVTSLHIATS